MQDNGLNQWLDSHINFETGKLSRRATMPTLERIQTLVKYLGDPQEHVKSIHVTGTNGKTSVVRITESLLRAKGLFTGLMTSPHLVHMNERICLDGQAVTDEQLIPILNNIRNLEQHIEEISKSEPSWFEILVAASFCVMSENAVDVGVIEVGMGGKFDATNVCQSEVSVLTNVNLDHMEYLGSTREKIATEKSGIIKFGNKVVIGEDDEALSQIWISAAKENQADPVIINEHFELISNEQAVGGRLVSFTTPYSRYEDIFVPIFGAHQGVNTMLAVVAAECFIDAPLGEEVIVQGLDQVRNPGRMEVLNRDPLIVIDGAHNVSGAQTFSAALDEEFPRSQRIYIVGLSQEKDPTAMIDALNVDNDDIFIATQSDSARAMSASALAEAARKSGIDQVIEKDNVRQSLENAMALALDDTQIIATGSLYVVGELREALSQQS